jgi:putative flippase GtrA
LIARRLRGALPELGRHQIAALVATALDFLVMTAGVELLGARPSLAALAGSAAGALCNFQLGRCWVFPGRDAPWKAQALRYGAVSAGSALWNALGVELGQRLGIPYLAARVAVAVLVSVVWNFPMHRSFVFQGRLP